MTRALTREKALTELLISAGAIAAEGLSEEEALLWMALIHLYDIRLVRGTLIDAPDITVLEAATEREAAEVIADLWSARADERARYHYWYHAYQAHRYQVPSDVPSDHMRRIVQLRESLLRDPRVVGVEEAE